MRGKAAVMAVWVALGCSEGNPVRPPALACMAADGGCSAGPVGGAGSGGTVPDAGSGGPTDAGRRPDAGPVSDGGVVRVSGRVALYQSLPGVVQNGPTVMPAGWTVSVLDAPELTVELDGTGTFGFGEVPTAGEGAGRYYGLLASPAGRDLRSLRIFDPSVSTAVLPAVSLDAMQAAVAGAMGLVQPEAGHIVLLARESADPTARGLAGVRVQPVAEPSAVYYDSMLNPESLQVADTQTGSLGLAVVLNLTASPTGTREVSLQVNGPAGGVNARVPVLARTITWITYIPGR